MYILAKNVALSIITLTVTNTIQLWHSDWWEKYLAEKKWDSLTETILEEYANSHKYYQQYYVLDRETVSTHSKVLRQWSNKRTTYLLNICYIPIISKQKNVENLIFFQLPYFICLKRNMTLNSSWKFILIFLIYSYFYNCSGPGTDTSQ